MKLDPYVPEFKQGSESNLRGISIVYSMLPNGLLVAKFCSVNKGDFKIRGVALQDSVRDEDMNELHAGTIAFRKEKEMLGGLEDIIKITAGNQADNNQAIFGVYMGMLHYCKMFYQQADKDELLVFKKSFMEVPLDQFVVHVTRVYITPMMYAVEAKDTKRLDYLLDHFKRFCYDSPFGGSANYVVEHLRWLDGMSDTELIEAALKLMEAELILERSKQTEDYETAARINADIPKLVVRLERAGIRRT